jgi:hypothetical protein
MMTVPDRAYAQLGIITNVERDVDVLLSTGEVVEGTPTSNLQPFLHFAPDQHVLHMDGRFGTIGGVGS